MDPDGTDTEPTKADDGSETSAAEVELLSEALVTAKPVTFTNVS